MKKLLLTLALVAATGLPLSATQYTFGNFDIPLTGSGPLTLQLGVFGSGFSPTGANATDWLANWVTEPGSDGYYDETGPEWGVNLALADNSTFAENQQLYLWAFDTQAGIGSNWALYTDTSWLMGHNELDGNTAFLEFTAGTSAVFGSLDFAGGSASTSVVSAAAVPDSASTGLLFGFCGLALAGLRSRFRRVTVA